MYQHKYKVFVYLSNTKDRFQRRHSLKVKTSLNYAKTQLIHYYWFPSSTQSWWVMDNNWKLRK